MKNFKILVDSTVDVTKEMLKEIDAQMIPLSVHIGTESYLDSVELDSVKLYERIAATKAFPKTSAVSPGEFMVAFENLKKQGITEAIWVGIGHTFSATVQNAHLAAKDVPGFKLRVVDTYSLSSGGGLVAMRAHDLRSEGKSLDEVADYLNDLAKNVRAQFIVDKLDMLAAGGRVTGIKLFFGRILKAHPFLQINDGKLEVADTPKGKSEKALDVMLKVAETEIKAGLESPRVFITHSIGGDRVDYIKERLLAFVDEKDIYPTNAGAVISSHCGEGTIGILYIRKEVK